MVNEASVLQALRQVKEPVSHRDIVDLQMVRNTVVMGQRVAVTIALPNAGNPAERLMLQEVYNTLIALPGVQAVDVNDMPMSAQQRKALEQRLHADAGGQPAVPVVPVNIPGGGFSTDGKKPEPQSMPRQLSPVKQVIGVLSGKGGVGKTMVTALLAAELHRRGFTVGVQDADITGASIPKVLGVHKRLKKIPEGIAPSLSAGGIRVVSANLMLRNPDDPVAWRGSRIGQILTDLWRDVVWGPLDFLLVDMPPGTSDAALTVLHDMPLAGVLMVTMPQDLASLIVRKAVNMTKELHVPLLGIVENMSYFICPESGRKHYIFGPSHVESVLQQAGVPLLATLPIRPEVAQAADRGVIEQVTVPEIAELATNLLARLEA